MAHILIAGLGNPGEFYEDTRHNIGFNIIDAIAKDLDFPQFSSKFSALISSKIIKNDKITLLKPQSYMNLSGEPIAKAINFYKIDLNNFIVIHDDLDLALAKVKIKIAGGSGGHNGIKSIDQHIGLGYYRVRIGIGKPLHKQDTSNFVLKKFSKEEQQQLAPLIKAIINNFELILEKNFPMFMNKIAMEQQKNGI